ncbi:MAG: JEMB protein [Alphaproteobacteria bacterium RIFCSPLOWO2_01_FULL_40_26]|nr:MAG: JEMB protein [Alphaproteobacteria bacterium RIFCSPHIGHO2_02_FULL_40_34]OFW87673.1 MAG: JEMB protein [Alphaproteobacteria bacterium RIFCSPHIGHO2_01_FULL_40_8]OFW94888.1 MAG: JEMB protein [Alphaproteobacteria bacterium RIFCSPLOWO2_01_FULL_40_26]OFX10514.1 MAG: JEMB protein [Alphaproteobacteria bacterium RIFCSPLOWO2_02_FULL_40_19]OFX10889.1 MAG: JEMB protein [Alphaproteobacteria bacterium RIFCSPLOWO2_12_FULL_40_11]
MKIANTTQAPCYAVIFTSLRFAKDNGYLAMSKKMIELAQKQDGCLGYESAREDLGITVSYWRNLESIKKWKENSTHLFAQKQGKEKWYSAYKVRICKVEHDYEFTNNSQSYFDKFSQ